MDFKWKPLAVATLEVLSVVCYFSEEGHHQVVQAFRTLAKARREPPFAILVGGIIDGDNELKGNAMTLINNLVNGSSILRERATIRAELQAINLVEVFDSVLDTLSSLEIIPDGLESKEDSSGRVGRRDSIKMNRQEMMNSVRSTLSTRQTLTRTSAIHTSMMSNLGAASDAEVTLYAADGTPIDPENGKMAGECIAAKNRNETTHQLAGLLGSKSTKHRWYVVDGQTFRWYRRDKRDQPDGAFDMARVLDIRPGTSDPHISKETPHGFEIVTDERVFALGADTEEQKGYWITALSVARDQAVLRAGVFRLASNTELDAEEVCRFASMTAYLLLLTHYRCFAAHRTRNGCRCSRSKSRSTRPWRWRTRSKRRWPPWKDWMPRTQWRCSRCCSTS